LTPLLVGKRSLAELSDGAVADAIRTLLPWDLQQKLEAEAPARWQAPTGSKFHIDYGADGGPRVEARVMELYGLSEHPTAAGVPLTLALLSPGHKPIQITKDLPGFWRGTWKEVRTEMKGRYPRHVWPEEPWLAQATTRAKPRGT
jgi:ATP-dependent helicase HrpB